MAARVAGPGDIPRPRQPAARSAGRTGNGPDRFYEDTARRRYLTPGQKESIRAVSAARSGDSVICVLPTGSGKTDMILTRAFQPSPAVMPDRAHRRSCARPRRRVKIPAGRTARSPTTGEPGQEKKELAQRLRDGVQWLIITSPEAACTVLARPLEAAAAEGRLDLFAIDEAHIVAEWGDAFRPAFQSLAGLRRRLIDRAPAGRKPVTVMLTGTLDDYGLQTLRRLFPGDRESLSLPRSPGQNRAGG